MEKKVLYIDMDGVIANFYKKFSELRPDIDLTDGDDSELRGDEIDKVCLSNPNLFSTLEPMEDAVESIHKLSEHYEIYFLSTPVWADPNSWSGKRLWIETHFGEFGKKRLILTHRKDLNVGDYLVDDRIKNGVDKFQGEHLHYGTEKFPNWSSIVNYLIQ